MFERYKILYNFQQNKPLIKKQTILNLVDVKVVFLLFILTINL
jgi:hypothetical protein